MVSMCHALVHRRGQRGVAVDLPQPAIDGPVDAQERQVPVGAGQRRGDAKIGPLVVDVAYTHALADRALLPPNVVAQGGGTRSRTVERFPRCRNGPSSTSGRWRAPAGGLPPTRLPVAPEPSSMRHRPPSCSARAASHSGAHVSARAAVALAGGGVDAGAGAAVGPRAAGAATATQASPLTQVLPHVPQLKLSMARFVQTRRTCLPPRRTRCRWTRCTSAARRRGSESSRRRRRAAVSGLVNLSFR